MACGCMVACPTVHALAGKALALWGHEAEVVVESGLELCLFPL